MKRALFPVLLAAAAFIAPERSARSDASVVTREKVEISPPILPRTSVLYTQFPSTLEGEQAMAHDAALQFDWLLTQCAARYPEIILNPEGGADLPPEQLRVNYDAVARCSYEVYSAKPYWIPKLVDDVDICGTELGAGWRLITEADLGSLIESDYGFIKATLQPTSPSDFALSYFSLRIWVRANDGRIAEGTLAPGMGTARVTPLSFNNGFSYTDHYEGSLALRCIRRTDLP